MPLFLRNNLASALSVLLCWTILISTSPVPLAAQLPQLPTPVPVQIPGQQPKPAPEQPAPVPVAQPEQQALPPVSQMTLPDDAPPFHITVIEGEGAINNIHQQVNRAATVIVEDENKTPLSGVAVTFFLPNDGPSGLFPNGSRVLTVFSDEKGYAVSRPIRFNTLIGIMPIRVSASLFSQSVSATITQTNVGSGQAIRSYVSPITRNQEPGGHGIHISKKVVIIVAAIGAAAAAGVYYGTKSSPPTATIGGTTTVGAGTIGAPAGGH